MANINLFHHSRMRSRKPSWKLVSAVCKYTPFSKCTHSCPHKMSTCSISYTFISKYGWNTYFFWDLFYSQIATTMRELTRVTFGLSMFSIQNEINGHITYHIYKIHLW